MPCEISYVRYKSTQVFAVKSGQIAISSRGGLCPIEDLSSFERLTTLRSTVRRDGESSLQNFAQSRTKQESPTAYYVIGEVASDGQIPSFAVDTIKAAIASVDIVLGEDALVNGHRKGFRNGGGFRSSLKDALRGFDIISSDQLSDVDLEPIIKNLLTDGHNITNNDLKALLAAQRGKTVSLIKAQIRSDATIKAIYTKYQAIIESNS
ncbi:hypothetical protein C9I99_20945 [Photobacterium lutimaris]|uniref:Uncharacterized protein n=2 Tax=Photobacterium lutimaris TaxID=388278 RepID=A0A2T3ITH0_9GAMM|nr:hypothetical protein C9I99_20945 [Photobacterium lutimaris]